MSLISNLTTVCVPLPLSSSSSSSHLRDNILTGVNAELLVSLGQKKRIIRPFIYDTNALNQIQSVSPLSASLFLCLTFLYLVSLPQAEAKATSLSANDEANRYHRAS